MTGQLQTCADFAQIIDSSGAPYEGAPLAGLLAAQAAVRPDAPALTIGRRTLTFAQLESASNRRARALLQAGVGERDRVIVSMPNRTEFVECVYALWKIGAIPCPVSHRLTSGEFEQIHALVAPRCVIGVDAALARLGTFHDATQELDPKLSDAALPVQVVTPWRIMNSGGSTGRPKLIVDPKPASWGWDKRGRDRHPRTTLVAPGPLYHSGPFSYTTMAIAEGSHVIAFERFDAMDWVRAVERYRPDYAYLVPTMMHRIARSPATLAETADLSSIKTLIHMAAPCPPDLKRWWIDRLGAKAVLEVYGGTERIGATVIDGAEWLLHPGSVGKASEGDEIVILGPDKQKMPAGEIGEIHFRRQKAPGSDYAYIGAETRIVGDLDSFGDLGWLDADGYLYIADRRTDMVVVGGVNVFPAEIEACIEGLDDVLCCAVIGLPDEDLGSRLHAIVELAPEMRWPSEGMDFMAPALERLSPVKRPQTVEFTHERLRDDAGKVRRSALRAARL
jgi:bile acid-coenzyme A ligase